MSWIMRANIFYIEPISVYAANKKVYEYTTICFKWEVLT